MARVKQTSRNSSKKRFPLATLSKKKLSRVKRSNQDRVETVAVAEEVKDESLTQFSAQTVPSKITSHTWAYISSSGNSDVLFCEGVTEKMEDLPNNAGKWMLFNNEDCCAHVGMSHHDYCWEVAKSLVLDFKNTGIISAKCSTSGTLPQSVVCCYTADYKNKEDAKKAADAIRKVYPYPTNMYYKPEKDVVGVVYNRQGDRLVSMYKHTIENKFYERGSTAGNKWQLLTFSDEQIIINEEILPSRVDSHQWLYISSSVDNTDEFRVGTSDYMENLPDAAGKWLLFNDATDVCPHAGMSHHDNAWQAIRHLVTDFKNTKIIAIKCSTNRIDKFGRSGKGVICCYTADYNNKIDVKKAADAIREAYLYPGPIYYKTEEDSDSGIYRLHGDRQVAIYKHCSDNTMFERDLENQGEWIPADPISHS